MNYKKMMLVAFVLLAILTIGAVSASDGGDELAADESGADDSSIAEAPDYDGEILGNTTVGGSEPGVDDDNENTSTGNGSIMDNGQGGDINGSGEKYNVTLTVYRPDKVYFNDELYIYADVDAADEGCEEFPSGDVVLYLNGEEVGERPLWDSSYYFEILEFGVYDFKMEYLGDEYFNGASEEFTYNVTNTMYHIYVSSGISYGAKEFNVYTSVLNPSNIEITINGKKFKVYDDYGDLYCNASELSYGLNTVDIYYPGDEVFGEYSGSENITVESYIRVDSEEHILGEPVLFYLNVPSNATGTLTVYSREDVNYDEWIDTEIASAQVENGNATVILTDVPVGVPMFYANFTGSVEVPDASYWMSIEPIMTVPKAIIAGEDKYVVVKTATNTPDCVEVRYVEYEEDIDHEWEDYTKLGPVPVLNNQSNVSLAGLKEGYYEVYVFYYYGGDEESYINRFSKRFYLDVLDEYDIDLNITDYSENIIVDDTYNYVDYNIASYAEGLITLYIDGKAVANTTADGRDTFIFSSEGLSIGEHTLSLNFTSETQPASSDAVKFNVVAATIYIPDESIINSRHASTNNIEVRVSENATGIITVLIDNELFGSEAVDAPASEKVNYVFFLSEVSRGKHNVSVLFMDDKYGDVYENKTVDFGYVIHIYAEGIYGENNIITVDLPNDLGNGDLTITVDGNNVEGTRNASMVTVNPSVLAMGNHTVVVKYAGDDFYPAGEFNCTFDVFAEIKYPYGNLLVGTDKGVSLTLPEDAKGKLNVTVEVEEYDDTEGMDYWAVYDNMLVSFENGTAYYSFASLPIGFYHVIASYTGNDYEVYEIEHYFDVNAIDWGDEYMSMGENKTVTFISIFDDPGQLRIILSKIVDERKEWDNPVNVVETLVINFTGRVSHTFTNLRHGHYHVFLAEEYVNGPLKGYQGSFDFYVETPEIEAESGEFVIGSIPPIVIKFPANADGTVAVTVHTNLTKETHDLYKTVNVPVSGLTTIDLNEIITETGNYELFFKYAGNYGEFDGYNLGYKIIAGEKLSPNIEVNATQNVVVGDDVVFEISSPALSLSKIVVSIDGKEYNATPVLGKSTITVSGLAGGNYNANVTFVGDLVYKSESKIIPITVVQYDPVITAKDTTVLYTANGKFSVTVKGIDGKLANNAKVIFMIAGKQVGTAYTNSNGVATYIVKNVPGTYKISATALGKTVTKKLTVKHLVTLKTVTVKKSAKKIVLQATLAKVNGKYLKNKKITFKFNGKKYANIKTNSKGVAKLTIKNAKSGKNTYNFAKLKVGKKITYMATYLKDTVKKTAKVKK